MPLPEPDTVLLYEYGDACLLPAAIDPAELKHYLRQVWQSRHWHHGYPPGAGTGTAGSQPYLRFDGRWVQARNHVGTIHFQGFTLCLLPKLFSPANEIISLPVGQAGFQKAKPPAAQADFLRSVFTHLDFYLSHCRHVRFPFQWHTAPGATPETLQMWIRMFASATGNLLARQPYQTYQPLVAETAFLRGKLAVSQYIGGQVARGQWQHFQTEQQPFTMDNRFNQIVRHTVRRLLHLGDSQNRLLLQAIESQLDGVEDAAFTPDDCDALHLGRLHEKHRHVLEMCRFFLAGETGAASGASRPGFTFLLPMERVFEDFVAGFLKKHFPQWQTERQRSVKLAVDNRLAAIYAKPDIWLPKQNTVWDTKYKLLDATQLSKQIPPADLYQLLAYAAACRTENVHLLYASVRDFASARIDFALENQTVKVHAHTLPVVLAGDDDTFLALTLRMQEMLRKIAGTPAAPAELGG